MFSASKALQSPSRGRVIRTMQAARFEGSLMTSLAELKSIEHQRLADERAAVIRADELRKYTALEAERRVREAAERKLREERESALAIEQAKVAAERELRLRVEHVEQAERERQQVALEQERHAQEIELRKAEVANKRPRWMMTVTSLALALAAVLVVFTVKAVAASSEADDKRKVSEEAALKAEADVEKMRLELVGLETNLRELDGKVDLAIKRVAEAQTKAEATAAAGEVKRLANEKREAAIRAAELKAQRDLKLRLDGVKNICTRDSVCRENFKK